MKPVSSTIPLQVPLEAIGPHPKSRPAPTIEASIKTRIISRLHTLASAPPPGQTVNASPSFQEIFYEWSVSLKANRQSVASLKADYLQGNDVFRVDPEGATAERIPESPMEFKAYDTSKPAHYALIVKSDDLTETQPLTVTIRRSINASLVDSDLIKLAYVRSATSKIDQSTYDVKADVERLNRQAKTIAAWRHGPQTTPLPIHSPGDVPPGVMQSAVEAWCKDEECKEMALGNLIADWDRLTPGTSPEDRWSIDGSKLILGVAASKQAKWVTMTVNTAELSPFAKEYSLMIIVRVLDNRVEALTDSGIAKSGLFTVTGEVRTIQVDLSDDFIARSDAISQRHDQMSLQFYIVLIPKHIRAEQIITLTDVTTLGGVQLQSHPSPEIKSPVPFK